MKCFESYFKQGFGRKQNGTFGGTGNVKYEKSKGNFQIAKSNSIESGAEIGGPRK